LEYFDKALENDSLKYIDIEHYARLLDNRAYSKYLLNDTIGLENIFLRSLKIRDSVKNLDGVATVKLHLAEYYDKKKQYSKALHFANEVLQSTKKISSNELYLESLSLLSKLDTLNSKDHLTKYISFNDSLRNIESKTQNKFARISFETDEYIEETKRLSKQKIQILIISLVIVLIVSLIYYIIIQRSRNKRLLLETEQQKANEQVYILTLDQQTKLEEEKTKERNRISQELHDNILGKLFGVRIDLGFLEIDGSSDTIKQHEMFLEELQHIEKEIREVSHKLNANFSSSEIDFSSILKQLLENKSHLSGFMYLLNLGEELAWDEVNEIIKVNLYRILQEALQNVIKYAKAKNVVLDFSVEKDNLIVTINDNGTGFDIDKRKKGIGIKNMKSRIQKLKGVFNIRSEIGKGTTIYFTIPIH
jgi:signal transduction histidine kinase